MLKVFQRPINQPFHKTLPLEMF